MDLDMLYYMFDVKKEDNVVKKFFQILWLMLVGPEGGFTGEGNEQWYYSVSLAINLMLVWWLAPEVALAFTFLSIIHYVSIFVYGYNLIDIDFNDNREPAWFLAIIHIGIFLFALKTSVKWTLITGAITMCAFFIAPDCVACNIFTKNCREEGRVWLARMLNTAVFIAFVVVDILLPTKLWIKIAIIVVAIILHPIIDFFEGECVIISDVVRSMWEGIKG